MGYSQNNSGKKTHRMYHGDPLAYFKSHPGVFNKYKTRNELARGDSGMYRALLRSNQIGEAYSKVRDFDEPLPPEEVSDIVNSHDACGGVARRAARGLNHSATTITKYWRLNGEEVSNPKVSDSEHEQIIALYRKHENASHVGELLDRSHGTVIRHCRTEQEKIRKEHLMDYSLP